jgi:ubiquinone/menaquinone biosynthesis C-methylase UbiE
MAGVADALWNRVAAELSSIAASEGPVVLDAATGPVVLDAATGAGNCTVRVAQMLARGRVVTVDNDPVAWTGFAQAKVEAAGLSDRVQFLEADIAQLTMFENETFDLVVSTATLSTMGLNVVDGIRELFRVTKRGALLAVSDLLPQPQANTPEQRNAVDAWRLSKAISVLAGEPHYEELPLDWVCRRLSDAGFVVEWQAQESAWPIASEESLQEYLSNEEWKSIADSTLREFLREQCLALKERVRREGMAAFSPRYALCARRPK